MYRLTAVAALATAASAAVLSLVDTDAGITTIVPSAVSTIVPDNCSTRHVCADYINECGMWYGGCFPDCRPWPTFTPPLCPSNRTSTSMSMSTSTSTSTSSSALAPVTTPTPTRRPCNRPPSSSSSSSSSSEPCGGAVECVTSHLTCYSVSTTITWGGCYPACSPRPMYTPPPCPVATVTSSASSSSHASSAPSSSSSSLPCRGDTACVTSLRDCSTTKVPFGGCYPACSPRPIYSPPPCPQATTTSSSSSSSSQLCGGETSYVSHTRDCKTTQIPYGGCYPACFPKPWYHPPACPEAAASSSSSSSSYPYALAPPMTTLYTPTTTAPPPLTTLVPPVTTIVPHATPSTSSSELPCGGSTTCSTFYRTCPATTLTFGGCQPACYPKTFYTPPPCPVSTSFSSASSSSTSSCA